MTDKTNKKFNAEDNDSIDLLRLIYALWHSAWLIVLAGIIVAAAAFAWSSFVVTPMYSATTMLYVNNNNISVGSASFNISASDISASQSLVKTYIVILKNRTTLNQVLQKTGLNYSYAQLSGMISADAVNNTQVFYVTVTCENAENAAALANAIAEVMPVRVADIIDGSSVRLVDEAVVQPKKVSPNITKNTALGFIIGAVIAAAIICILELLDDMIRSEDYLIQTYDIPVLAKIPDVTGKKSGKYGYYYSSYASSKEDSK